MITTPNHLHAPQTKAALEAGCHVLVEKPFTLDSEEGESLVSVETAKAIVDVPSPEQGLVKKLFVAAGDIPKVGDALVEFDSDAGADEKPADSGTVVGEMESNKGTLTEAATKVGKNGKGSGGIKATPAVRALALDLRARGLRPGRVIHAAGLGVDAAWEDLQPSHLSAGGTQQPHQ